MPEWGISPLLHLSLWNEAYISLSRSDTIIEGPRQSGKAGQKQSQAVEPNKCNNMAIILFFLFASMLLLLVTLVLALTIHLTKSKHLHNTLSRSHSKKMRIDSSASGNSSCQTCHLCGGLRLRTPNAAFLDDFKGTKSQSRRLDDAARGPSRTTRHQWAAMKTHLVVSIKQAVQKVISQHKKQAHKDFLTKLSLSTFSRRKMTPQSRDVCVVPAGLSTSECSSPCLTGSFVDGTVSDAIAAGATTEFDKSMPQDNPKSTNVDPQGAPIHRVVLEILVGNANESSPGLTLKLETSATLEHLAGCVEALKGKDAKNCEHIANTAHGTCGGNDALPKTLGSGCAHGDQASLRLTPILKEAILLPKDDIKCSDFVSKLETAGREPIIDSILSNKGALKGRKDCVQCGHMSGDNIECECPKIVKCSALCGQLKFRSSNYMHENAASVVVMQPAVEAKEGSEMASGVPLNKLGSLHISFLKASEQEDDADVNRQAGSMLASLNVTEKVDGGIGSSNMKKEKFGNKLCVLSDTSYSSKSDFIGGPDVESVCRENLMKEEERCPLQASEDTLCKDDFSLPSKKGKKKKKNRGKKPKVNTESFLADAKEMQEIGKIALEAAEHVSAVPERELGCVCGALKGNLHNESCPYPFTSSGSMLQRKMREQYNHLVRSNAAKTLTLAQVGQFTSCLVEAKATLRQKSESIQRKFTIAKSLLSKADKSSFDRLCGQIYGLEMEQKKLEEDTVVYNRLQEQLKLSPAYQKMLEYGRAHFELQPNTGQMIEKLEPEDSEMSFEEFLAQEKKDGFWQRHNLTRSVPAS